VLQLAPVAWVAVTANAMKNKRQKFVPGVRGKKI
jgi:hypothetical protein